MSTPAERHGRLLHKHYGDDRSRGDVVADKFVAVFGSWSYIIWQTVVIVLWMIGNTLILRSWAGLHHVPDPYPFILLNLGFSAQASYAAPLILMATNRAAARDKDFATHQFEIIDGTHQMLAQNTALTRDVQVLTSQVRELAAETHRLVSERPAGEPVSAGAGGDPAKPDGVAAGTPVVPPAAARKLKGSR